MVCEGVKDEMGSSGVGGRKAGEDVEDDIVDVGLLQRWIGNSGGGGGSG